VRVTIRLPGPLRERAGRRADVQAEGATVREVIDDLERRFPGMRFRLCEETGTLRPFVNIFVDADNIRDLQGLDTPVPDGATLYVLHSVAGGQATTGA
jgi:molybdopterin synthase sulfur carrier subunit